MTLLELLLFWSFNSRPDFFTKLASTLSPMFGLPVALIGTFAAMFAVRLLAQ